MSEPAQENEIWLTFAGMIDNEACKRLFSSMSEVLRLKFTRAHLLIQSAGGVVGDGIAMHNLLRGLPVEIVAYNAGATESIAVLPYLAGKTRRVSKNATFLIHRTRCSPLPVGANASDLRTRVDSNELYDRNVEGILRSSLQMPDDKWATHGAADLLISADDAVKFGLAHEIFDFAPIKGAPLFNI